MIMMVNEIYSSIDIVHKYFATLEFPLALISHSQKRCHEVLVGGYVPLSLSPKFSLRSGIELEGMDTYNKV